MLDFPSDATIPSTRIAELLAPTLGWEKSSDVVATAAARLGLASGLLSSEQALTLLDDLARTPGMVGITARFARSRLDALRAQPPSGGAAAAEGARAHTEHSPGPASRAASDPMSSGPSSARSPGSTPKPEGSRSAGDHGIAASGVRTSAGRSYDDHPPARSGPHSPSPATTITASEIAELLASAMGSEKSQEIVLGATRRLGFAPERLDKAQAMSLLDHLAIEPGVVGLCARFGKARLILRFAA